MPWRFITSSRKPRRLAGYSIRPVEGRARHSVRAAACRGLPALPFALPTRECLRYAACVDLPVRKKLPHTIPQWVADGSWFFITINCVPRGKNQLCRSDTGNAVLAAVKFNHERFVWHCRLCLLMPDHLHAIIAFPREPGMERPSRTGKSSLPENIAWIGNAISSITACVTITNSKRKPATS